MRVLAVVPVKNLSQSKSRLSPEINQQQRELLVSSLLRRTLATLKLAKCVDDILLVSHDARVRVMAEMEDVHFLPEQGAGLNQALEQATSWAMERNFAAVFILPLDIPFLAREDIRSIINMSEEKEEFVIVVPDRERAGTNALLVKPPGILQYQFGPGSFLRHCRQTLDRNIESGVYHSAEMSFDVDSPWQYRRLVKEGLTEFNLCRRC